MRYSDGEEEGKEVGGSDSLCKSAVLPLHLRRVVFIFALHHRHLPVHGLGQGDRQVPGGVPTEEKIFLVFLMKFLNVSRYEGKNKTNPLLLVHMRIVQELSISLAVGGVQRPVLHQEVDQAGGRGTEQVTAGIFYALRTDSDGETEDERDRNGVRCEV